MDERGKKLACSIGMSQRHYASIQCKIQNSIKELEMELKDNQEQYKSCISCNLIFHKDTVIINKGECPVCKNSGKNNVKQIILDLKKEFPNINGIKDMSEWNTAWEHRKNEAIFLGNCAEGGLIDDILACDYYSFEEDPEEEVYEMGVHVKLVKFLKERGFYVECYDPGTYCAYAAI